LAESFDDLIAAQPKKKSAQAKKKVSSAKPSQKQSAKPTS
jgi:hypothetical protein